MRESLKAIMNQQARMSVVVKRLHQGIGDHG